MAKKVILFISEDLDVGGTEKALIKWIKSCDRNCFEPWVISFRNGKLKDDLENLGVENLVLEKKGSFDLIFLLKLIKLLKQIRPDLVHCRNSIPAISYGVLAAKICSRHSKSCRRSTRIIRQNCRVSLEIKAPGVTTPPNARRS